MVLESSLSLLVLLAVGLLNLLVDALDLYYCVDSRMIVAQDGDNAYTPIEPDPVDLCRVGVHCAYYTCRVP